MTDFLQHAPLGQTVLYPSQYDAGLLFPIPRAEARSQIGIADSALPFTGWDLWNAYEMSWLNAKGLPQVGILRARVPLDSANIIESKSFKLYLNSFNQTRFDHPQAVIDLLTKDLSDAAAGTVEIYLIGPERFGLEIFGEFDGINLDLQDVEIDQYQTDPTLLELDRHPKSNEAGHVTEQLFSRLLKSNCPVTGQPDWACVQIIYSGKPIDHAGLLKYIVSFRMHSGFHENCVERIFSDIMSRCAPATLSVFARYTRRGGLDINPWRATPGMPAPQWRRSARQ